MKSDASNIIRKKFEAFLIFSLIFSLKNKAIENTLLKKLELWNCRQ